MEQTERLLEEIRGEIRKTNSTLREMLKEMKGYIDFRKAKK